MNVTLAYGLLARVQDRDDDIIGIGNGGSAASVNFDDGNLNYGRGIVSNQVRGTAELTLRWRNFGAFVRGYGLYDYENENEDRRHDDLSSDALGLVGSGFDLQDAYVTGRFELTDVPFIIRVGEQVVNWADSNFLRFGVDVVNPVDLAALGQPATTERDIFVRQGMIWSAANVTESIAIEGFYQYRWEPVVLSPVGSFLSVDDLIGGDGVNAAFEGFGRFSDLGTDLDDAFGLPHGTLGFDAEFMEIPTSGRDKPRNHGQYGFAVQALLPELNATKLALHFVNYHSRLPLISGFTANQAAIDATSEAAVNARAADLSAQTGLPLEETRPIAETLTIGELANETRYFASYPEDIKMLGVSFNTATIRTGTLVSGEVSRHFDWPVQILKEEVLVASLSPIQFTDAFGQTSLGSFGANQAVSGIVETDKTQVSLGVTQFLGRRLGAAQTFVSFDVGWVHIEDLPSSHPQDANSWGYRAIGQLTYDGVLGGLTLRPRVIWTHDVGGVTPGPGPAFIERRKSFTAGLNINYSNTWTSDLSYTTFFGGEPLNRLTDRDSVRFNVTFHY